MAVMNEAEWELALEDELALEPLWLPRRERLSRTSLIEPELYETGPGRQASPSTLALNRDQISVRITVVGHASPRWKTARNISEADRLNQRLSELRANNVRMAVAKILKRELPAVNIDVSAKGVGSRERFPGPYGDNWSIDRSVVVTVELMTKYQIYKTKPNPPRRIFAPSKFWEVTVVTLHPIAIGVATAFLRVVLKNRITGKRIVLSGTLYGGGLDTKMKINLGDKKSGSQNNPFNLGDRTNPAAIIKPVGHPVGFETPEALTFDEFDGQWVRIGRLNYKFVVGGDMTYLTFSSLKHSPKMLVFDSHAGLGWPSMGGYVMSGKVYMESGNPGDWFEVPSLPDLVPTQKVTNFTDGLVLTFPTGRANLADLTDRDRKRLIAFVINKARNIAVFFQSNFSYVR